MMTITLAPETEERLRETARREGGEFEANIAAVQEALDAIDQGRLRPFAEFMAEHRRKYPNPAAV